MNFGDIFGGSESSSYVDPNQSPYLKDIYGQAQTLYGQTPNLSGLSQGLLGLMPQVGQNLSATIGGQYLPGGQAFQDQMDAIGRSIMPQIDSRFARSGRFGSGLHKIGLGQALADAGTNLYQQERGRQMQAMSAAPSIYGGFGQTAATLPFSGLNAYRNIIGAPTVLNQSKSAGGGLADLAAGVGGFGLDMGWWKPSGFANYNIGT